MHRRITVILPEKTLQMIDRIAGKGNRSNLIDRAVKYYVREIERRNLKQQLKEGALCRAKRDLEIASEYFASEELI